MITEKLEFTHLNDSQPNFEELVFVCDGTGTHRLAILCVVDEDDDYEPDDDLKCYWYCEDSDERYSLSDYPFWAKIPEFVFPADDRSRDMTVFQDRVSMGKKEVNGTYEIVGSEIRKK